MWMSNMLGTGLWRCVCEQDTEHIHVIIAPTHVLELTICNLLILPRAVPVGMSILVVQPTHTTGVEVVDVDGQCVWYVEVCV